VNPQNIVSPKFNSQSLFQSNNPRLGLALITLVCLFTLLLPALVRDATITPGALTEGAISVSGGTQSWTFSANTGDAIVVRVGDEGTTSFTPKIQLFNPSSTQIATSAGNAAAEVAVTAAASGTFTITISDGSGANLTGSYRLTLVKTGSAITVSPGDDGGPMTNGVMHTGTILTGDLDVWTFNAVAGDALLARVGKITDTNSFTP